MISIKYVYAYILLLQHSDNNLEQLSQNSRKSKIHEQHEMMFKLDAEKWLHDKSCIIR